MQFKEGVSYSKSFGGNEVKSLIDSNCFVEASSYGGYINRPAQRFLWLELDNFYPSQHPSRKFEKNAKRHNDSVKKVLSSRSWQDSRLKTVFEFGDLEQRPHYRDAEQVYGRLKQDQIDILRTKAKLEYDIYICYSPERLKDKYERAWQRLDMYPYFDKFSSEEIRNIFIAQMEIDSIDCFQTHDSDPYIDLTAFMERPND